jgi:DNA modification methylase
VTESEKPQIDLFTGADVDEFRTALDRYGVWPTTVWDCDLSDPKTRRLKELIGDVDTRRVDGVGVLRAPDSMRRAAENRRQREAQERLERLGYGSARLGVLKATTSPRDCYKVTASIFNPAVAAWLLNCFAPPSGVVLDPFAGGGTRAIMSAKRGMDYVGTELRQEEIDAVELRCASVGVSDRVTIIQGDAREIGTLAAAPLDLLGGGAADFLMTCPPYYNLEQYEGGDADLSMLPTYEHFLAELRRVIAACRDLLRPGARACWVVGLLRDTTGRLLPLHHDVARLHTELGYRMREEIVLAMRNNGAIQRVGQFDKGDRRLIRVHEYALVFSR